MKSTKRSHIEVNEINTYLCITRGVLVLFMIANYLHEGYKSGEEMPSVVVFY